MSPLNEFVTAWWPVVVGLWTVVSSVVGLYARAVFNQLKEVKVSVAEIKEELTDYKLEVSKTYMPSADIKELVQDLKAFLIRIEDKVDGRKPQ